MHDIIPRTVMLGTYPNNARYHTKNCHAWYIPQQCTISNCHAWYIPQQCMISYQELSCLVHTPTMHDIIPRTVMFGTYPNNARYHTKNCHAWYIPQQCTISNCHAWYIPQQCTISYQELSCLVHTPTMHDIIPRTVMLGTYPNNARYHTKNCHAWYIPQQCMISYQELSCLVYTPTMHDIELSCLVHTPTMHDIIPRNVMFGTYPQQCTISYQEMSWSVDVHMIPVSTCYVLTSSICNW